MPSSLLSTIIFGHVVPLALCVLVSLHGGVLILALLAAPDSLEHIWPAATALLTLAAGLVIVRACAPAPWRRFAAAAVIFAACAWSLHGGWATLHDLQRPASPQDQYATDAEFLAAHRSGALPFAAWTHEAHCRLAFANLVASGRNATATAATVREDIQRFNARHAEKLTVGFHATMTDFWVWAVAFVMGQQDPGCREFAACWPAAAPLLRDSRLWQLFYSRSVMFSAAAKAAVVAPDVRPLLLQDDDLGEQQLDSLRALVRDVLVIKN